MGNLTFRFSAPSLFDVPWTSLHHLRPLSRRYSRRSMDVRPVLVVSSTTRHIYGIQLYIFILWNLGPRNPNHHYFAQYKLQRPPGVPPALRVWCSTRPCTDPTSPLPLLVCPLYAPCAPPPLITHFCAPPPIPFQRRQTQHRRRLHLPSGPAAGHVLKPCRQVQLPRPRRGPARRRLQLRAHQVRPASTSAAQRPRLGGRR